MKSDEKPIHVQRLARDSVYPRFYLSGAILFTTIFFYGLFAHLLGVGPPSIILEGWVFYYIWPFCGIGTVVIVLQYWRSPKPKIEFYSTFVRYTQENGSVSEIHYPNIVIEKNLGKTFILSLHEFDIPIWQQTLKTKYYMVEVKNARISRATCLYDWLKQRVRLSN